jgi:hypothetical protein
LPAPGVFATPAAYHPRAILRQRSLSGSSSSARAAATPMLGTGLSCPFSTLAPASLIGASGVAGAGAGEPPRLGASWDMADAVSADGA